MSTKTPQRVLRLLGTEIEESWLPSPDTEIVPGVNWGLYDCFFTPAFWVSRIWIDQVPDWNFRIGRNWKEEVVACLLGGHGMPAEMGTLAFERMRESGMLSRIASASEIEDLLAEPFSVGERMLRYRYPRQRARYLSSALSRLHADTPPNDPLEFREWVLEFDGIGLKTASWITRNVFGCDEVAILDVHIQRAGLLMGLFSGSEDVSRDYLEMENRLVTFAKSLGVRLAVLDDIVWRYMKSLNQLAITCLVARRGRCQIAA